MAPSRDPRVPPLPLSLLSPKDAATSLSSYHLSSK